MRDTEHSRDGRAALACASKRQRHLTLRVVDRLLAGFIELEGGAAQQFGQNVDF
jgi:hypothetical protein